MLISVVIPAIQVHRARFYCFKEQSNFYHPYDLHLSTHYLARDNGLAAKFEYIKHEKLYRFDQGANFGYVFGSCIVHNSRVYNLRRPPK